MLPKITPLKMPRIIKTAGYLSSQGNTELTENNLFCLKIEDNFIHQLFPLIQDNHVKKPNYFGERSIGAHITIIYPEENKKIDKNDIKKEHSFFVKDFVTAEIGEKIYYVLLIDSPSLLKLRKKYHLPDLLSFKGYSIPFHITIGVFN